MTKIFEEIAAERKRQNEKWGEQNHPMCGINEFHETQRFPQDDNFNHALKRCRRRCETEYVGWYDILMEEVCEAFLENEPEKQREEMIQVAAVAVQIIEYLDGKIKERNPFKGKLDERNCHCNNCEAKFREGDIVIKGGEEYCPECSESGCIADEEVNNA